MKEIQKQGRGQVTLEHILRNDRFRYENDFATEDEAIQDGIARSMKTFKQVCVVKTETGYSTNSHGVDLKGQVNVARFHRGQRLN